MKSERMTARSQTRENADCIPEQQMIFRSEPDPGGMIVALLITFSTLFFPHHSSKGLL
jgi:hypothetical protein